MGMDYRSMWFVLHLLYHFAAAGKSETDRNCDGNTNFRN
jgi:hypothetical protein